MTRVLGVGQSVERSNAPSRDPSGQDRSLPEGRAVVAPRSHTVYTTDKRGLGTPLTWDRHLGVCGEIPRANCVVGHSAGARVRVTGVRAILQPCLCTVRRRRAPRAL